MWTYHQSSGVLELNGTFSARGYSGSGQYKNEPSAQNLPGLGPIPQGAYTIGPASDHGELGTYVMALEPDPANVMFGRSAFFIHGDSVAHAGAASHGCIVLSLLVRVTLMESQDRRLEVVA